jgi:hypothetical protein
MTKKEPDLRQLDAEFAEKVLGIVVCCCSGGPGLSDGRAIAHGPVCKFCGEYDDGLQEYHLSLDAAWEGVEKLGATTVLLTNYPRRTKYKWGAEIGLAGGSSFYQKEAPSAAEALVRALLEAKGE